MKKLIPFFTIMAIAMMTGCANVDYGCTWDFKVVNNADLNVVVLWNGAIIKEAISPGDELIISSINTECGKQDGDLGDLRPQEEEIMNISSYSEPTILVKIGDEVLPEAVMKRKYWEYSSEKYHGTYTLTLTDELIETIKNEHQ